MTLVARGVIPLDKQHHYEEFTASPWYRWKSICSHDIVRPFTPAQHKDTVFTPGPLKTDASHSPLCSSESMAPGPLKTDASHSPLCSSESMAPDPLKTDASHSPLCSSESVAPGPLKTDASHSPLCSSESMAGGRHLGWRQHLTPD